MRGGIAVLASLLVAGCAVPLEPATGPREPNLETVGLNVVLALVDTGINPYHAAFALDLPRAPPETLPPWEMVPQDFRLRLEADGVEVWKELERGKLYWFEGTRVLGIALYDDIPEEFAALESVFPPDPHPILDDVEHGTATASVAARFSPSAWILMVETTALDLPAFAWVAQQAWIDVVSSSINNLGHTPGDPTSNRDALADSYRTAVQTGKLVLNSGGNTPDPNLLSHSGAPWVISVGGAEGDDRGPSPLTSQPVDVVANFSWDGLAHSDGQRTYSSKGTSFGAPAVAGVLAEAVYRLREAHGHRGGIVDGALVSTPSLTLTNADFRNALNLTATYWDPSQHQPSWNTSQSPAGIVYETTNPALPHVAGTPVGPWVQMGWGFVDASTTDAIVALLEGRTQPPDKQDATAYMERLFELRSALWDARQRSP